MTNAYMHLHRTLLGLGLVTLGTTSAVSAQSLVYIESGGLVTAQLESAAPDGWTLGTQLSGYSGEGHFTWDLANYWYPHEAGLAGILDFGIEISNPGEYFLNLRNRHDFPLPTEENDVWIRMDQGPWMKVFSNGVSSVGQWTWETRSDLGGGFAPTVSYVLSAGQHTLSFSARSHGFSMDRFNLALLGHPDSFNGALAESQCRIGVPYGVAVANSSGAIGQVEGYGSLVVSRNNVTLHGLQLPVGAIGFFIVSDTQIFFAHPGGSTGNVLVGPFVGRYGANVLIADGAGRVSMPVDLTQIPRPNGPVPCLAGQTWNFQFWHRDTTPGGNPTSNFTRALSLTFH